MNAFPPSATKVASTMNIPIFSPRLLINLKSSSEKVPSSLATNSVIGATASLFLISTPLFSTYFSKILLELITPLSFYTNSFKISFHSSYLSLFSSFSFFLNFSMSILLFFNLSVISLIVEFISFQSNSNIFKLII